MRASATSRTASPANPYASQSKADANKADDASPFALLVATVNPKGGTKPAKKDASNSGDADKQADDNKSVDSKSAGNKTPDNGSSQAQAAPVSSQPSAKPPVKDAKPDKDKIADKADDDSQIAAALAQEQVQSRQMVLPPDQQTAPPPAQAAAPVTPAESDSDDTETVPAAPAALAPQTKLPAQPGMTADIKAGVQPGIKTDAGPKADAPTPPKMPARPALAAQAASPVDIDMEEDSETDATVTETAAAPVTAPPVKTNPPPQAAAVVSLLTANTGQTDSQTNPAPNIAKTDAPNTGIQNTGIQTTGIHTTGDASTQNKDVQSNIQRAGMPRPDAVQNGNPQSNSDAAGAKDVATDPSLNEPGKNANIKTFKTRSLQAGDAAKSDAAKNDTATSEPVRTASPQPDTQTAATPKSAPQPAPAAIFAVNSIAAPQALNAPVATATANPHVQVSAQASPDLPALAVEIAAKSQSGAKQFDIRLDPPELGRVEVRLSIDATGKASAHLSADQPQTLTLLQKDAPVLTRALRDAGLDVSQDGLNFSLRQQSENNSGNAGNNGRRSSARAFTASVAIEATTGTAAYRGIANGRLDIRV